MFRDPGSRLSFEKGCISFHLGQARVNLETLSQSAIGTEQPRRRGVRNSYENVVPQHAWHERCTHAPTSAPDDEQIRPRIVTGEGGDGRRQYTRSDEVEGKHNQNLTVSLGAISDSLHDELGRFLQSFGTRLTASEQALAAACDRASVAADQGLGELRRHVETRLAQQAQHGSQEVHVALESFRTSLSELRSSVMAQQTRVESLAIGDDFGHQLREASRAFDQKMVARIDALERRGDEARAAEIAKQRAWRDMVEQRCDALEKRGAKQKAECEALVDQISKMIPDVQGAQELCDKICAEKLNVEGMQRRLIACEAVPTRVIAMEHRVNAVERQMTTTLDEHGQKLQEVTGGLGAIAGRLSTIESSSQAFEQHWRSAEQRLIVGIERQAARARNAVDDLREHFAQRLVEMDTRHQRRVQRLKDELLRRHAQPMGHDMGDAPGTYSTPHLVWSKEFEGLPTDAGTSSTIAKEPLACPQGLEHLARAGASEIYVEPLGVNSNLRKIWTPADKLEQKSQADCVEQPRVHSPVHEHTFSPKNVKAPLTSNMLVPPPRSEICNLRVDGREASSKAGAPRDLQGNDFLSGPALPNPRNVSRMAALAAETLVQDSQLAPQAPRIEQPSAYRMLWEPSKSNTEVTRRPADAVEMESATANILSANTLPQPPIVETSNLPVEGNEVGSGARAGETMNLQNYERMAGPELSDPSSAARVNAQGTETLAQDVQFAPQIPRIEQPGAYRALGVPFTWSHAEAARSLAHTVESDLPAANPSSSYKKDNERHDFHVDGNEAVFRAGARGHCHLQCNDFAAGPDLPNTNTSASRVEAHAAETLAQEVQSESHVPRIEQPGAYRTLGVPFTWSHADAVRSPAHNVESDLLAAREDRHAPHDDGILSPNRHAERESLKVDQTNVPDVGGGLRCDARCRESLLQGHGAFDDQRDNTCGELGQGENAELAMVQDRNASPQTHQGPSINKTVDAMRFEAQKIQEDDDHHDKFGANECCDEASMPPSSHMPTHAASISEGINTDVECRVEHHSGDEGDAGRPEIMRPPAESSAEFAFDSGVDNGKASAQTRQEIFADLGPGDDGHPEWLKSRAEQSPEKADGSGADGGKVSPSSHSRQDILASLGLGDDSSVDAGEVSSQAREETSAALGSGDASPSEISRPHAETRVEKPEGSGVYGSGLSPPARQDLLASLGLGDDSSVDAGEGSSQAREENLPAAGSGVGDEAEEDDVEAMMAQTMRASSHVRQATAVTTPSAASAKSRSMLPGRGLGLRIGGLSLGRAGGRGTGTRAGNLLVAEGGPSIARMSGKTVADDDRAASDESDDIEELMQSNLRASTLPQPQNSLQRGRTRWRE